MGSLVAFLSLVLTVALTLSLIGLLAARRAAADKKATPVLSLLPGDISYESPSGNVRVYVPITTSIVLSIVLTLVMRYLA